MALSIIPIAAAVAVVGYDLLTNRPDIQSASVARVLRALALTGSAAAGDTVADIKVANRVVATLVNTATGFPTADASQFKTSYAVPAGAPVSVIITDAPATNSINLLIDL